MDDRPEWFSAKRYGFGTALPIRWQGWLVMAVYFAVTIGSAFLFAKRPVILLSIIFPASVIFPDHRRQDDQGRYALALGR